MLSVLALKMIHTEEHKNFEYVYQVNMDQFWEEVKETDIPFFRWGRWLEDKFNHLRSIHLGEINAELEEEKTRKEEPVFKEEP